MRARLYRAGARLKQHEMNYSTAADFELADESPVSAAIVLEQSGWSPYCIDHGTGELVLVRLPDGTDLAEFPFYFVGQYRLAQSVLKLPLAAIEPLTAGLPDPRLAIVYSMGRCGTTLASHALNASPHAWSLSEPEVFNHRSLMLPPDAPISGGALVRALTRLIFAGRTRRDATTLVLKLRSQSLFHMQTFIDGRPDARAVFMYRDALGWSQSVYQFLAEFDWPTDIPADQRLRRWDFFSGGSSLDTLAPLLDLSAPTTGLPEMIAAGWIFHIETYLERLRQGVQLLALRYNDLVADRRENLERLFHHAGLGTDGLAPALDAPDEDSQKGTTIGRRDGKRRLTDDELGRIRAVLARHQAFADPDLVLPDIYSR